MKEEKVSLFFKEGGSDKVYYANLSRADDLWVVHFAYGRRGSSLNTGSKTASPVDYVQAKKIFDKLVNEKKAKGYTEDVSGKPFEGTKETKETSGWIPQLLNPIEESDVEKYIKDPNYCAQEKFDGQNRLVITNKVDVRGVNKKGLYVDLNRDIQKAFDYAPKDGVFAGEIFSDYIVIFDWIDLTDLSYKERWNTLKTNFQEVEGEKVRLPFTAFTENEKRNLYNSLLKVNAEGIVFKDIRAKYTPGRPASGGPQVKFKFYATCSCVVTGINKNTRSVSIGLIHNDLQEVGNVTIYPNFEVPAVGSVVEVRYLYAYPGGSLYQPVYLGERKDVEKEECTITQLKYKRDEE